MKAKSLIFALSISLLMLGGCTATVGTGYDYYPAGQPAYYGYGRPYYAPRRVIVRPTRVYRQPYYGSSRGSFRSGGAYRGTVGHGGGHRRSR